MFIAARDGFDELARCLVDEYDANVNTTTFSSGTTPLIIAGAYGHVSMCRFLASRGADARVVDKQHQKTVFETAVFKPEERPGCGTEEEVAEAVQEGMAEFEEARARRDSVLEATALPLPVVQLIGKYDYGSLCEVPPPPGSIRLEELPPRIHTMRSISQIQEREHDMPPTPHTPKTRNADLNSVSTGDSEGSMRQDHLVGVKKSSRCCVIQ